MIKRLLFSIACVLLSPLAIATDISPARLLASYWVDGSAGLDLSGLSFCAGKLLTVSDRASKQIYAIQLMDGRAELVPYLKLSGLRVPKRSQAHSLWSFIPELFRPARDLDFEGITCGENGIYLLSERYNRIAMVVGQGEARWLENLWSPEVKARGYLQAPNVSSEGLVKAGDQFWLAIEREPRGLLRLSPGGDAQVFSLPSVTGLDFRGSPEDLTGLAYFDGALFTLEGNAHAVCRRTLPSLRAEWCLDYRALEKAPERMYEVAIRGRGGGVAVNEQGIFMVFDNDNTARAQYPGDRRALLLHLAFPDSL
ncbi:hypothetical protein [Microbulbifer sp. 2205BS26-8]|uniref:hypothetical protein n=1 Tax=Microbulbifer sp. 2205BS26-8 TaxID=3064386 RepID=UPI00273E0992|nr:hypothetical protein [Microbulbifer sp. 2205BS26-8]MDP5210649.1 hypothetical protein [Microbulbifer sp. 2205BS26-8]